MKLIKIITLICVVVVLSTSCKISNTSNEREPVSYNIPIAESATSSYQIADDNQINLSTISFKIPLGFNVANEDGELILENENGSIQINIQDKTNEIEDFDDFIQEKISFLKQVGLTPSETESITLGKHNAKRFISETINITGYDTRYFCYFIEINGSKIVIDIVSKDEALLDDSQADELVANIKFE